MLSLSPCDATTSRFHEPVVSANVPLTRLLGGSDVFSLITTTNAFGWAPPGLERWNVSGVVVEEISGTSGGGSGNVGLVQATATTATSAKARRRSIDNF